MLEHYTISDITQLKALSHASRVKILSTLADKPMTAKQLADLFGEEPAKTSYHVKQLLKVGLVELVYTRETQNGIVEKYYRAIAREFQTDPYLARHPEGRSGLESGMLKDLNRTQSDFVQALRLDQERGGDSTSCGFASVTLAAGEVAAFAAELQALVSRYSGHNGAGGNYVFHYLLFPRTGEDATSRQRETV